MSEINRTEIEKRIDILEDDIVSINPKILKLLLKDKTTKQNILWCTNDYEFHGPGYGEHDQIMLEQITGDFSSVIQPRAAKSKEIQRNRIKNHAEVFTPSWICNEQNNLIDDAWFGRSNVFNTPNGVSWSTTTGKIEFPDSKKGWKTYVEAKRLEITCGEAPYLVSRYDTTTGELIPLYERIGLFDRKMRIVSENCQTDEDWLKWAHKAIKSIYGYEFQGDSLLIARENILYDYVDYYKAHFHEEPPIEELVSIVNIIAWNIWQMDGMKYVVPYSCHDTPVPVLQIDLLGTNEEQAEPCPGCSKGDISLHNGIYCRIFDWTNLKKSIPFISIVKENMTNGEI